MTANEGITDLADTSEFDPDQQEIWDEQKAIYAGFLAGNPDRVDHRIAPEATIWDWETEKIANGHEEFALVRAARPAGIDVPRALSMVTEDPIITIHGDIALGRHRVTVVYELPDGRRVARTLRCTLQWQKKDGEWWIVHSHEDIIRERDVEVAA
ncbi:DUF4440 domain-containing protein [Microbacterium sp. 18062]|uniref:YybH family protein n=1 Tax=Microbacterium sp. 18062 TaxID=2681410 RepID=UPI00135900A2|nr:nuclear transport factor 2 family protein [Microbacterium sp. 18062]